jgi:hypothetical protein
MITAKPPAIHPTSKDMKIAPANGGGSLVPWKMTIIQKTVPITAPQIAVGSKRNLPDLADLCPNKIHRTRYKNISVLNTI